MKFIRFGKNAFDTAPTLYRIEDIESIVLYNSIEPENSCAWGEHKILLFIKGQDRGTAEVFPYDTIEEAKEMAIVAENRFGELLGLLNA